MQISLIWFRITIMTGRFISTIAGLALIVTRCVFARNELRVMHYVKSGKWELEVNGQCEAFVTKVTSGSSSSPNPEVISFMDNAECNKDLSGMEETPISSLTDKSPLKKMISSLGMSESGIPPYTFTTPDISFHKIEEKTKGGIGLKVSGTMDVTKGGMTSNLKDTLASLEKYYGEYGRFHSNFGVQRVQVRPAIGDLASENGNDVATHVVPPNDVHQVFDIELGPDEGGTDVPTATAVPATTYELILGVIQRLSGTQPQPIPEATEGVTIARRISDGEPRL
eukprot:g3126.t1